MANGKRGYGVNTISPVMLRMFTISAKNKNFRYIYILASGIILS